MNLDKLQINASLRSGWQALDLGFLLASKWWGALFLAAAVPASILFIPLLIIFPDNPLLATFIIWWLLPFLERLPLHIASRRAFAENPGFDELKSKALALYWKDLLVSLLWRRLSFQRTFDAPVSILEGLKARPRRNRLKVLHGKYSDVAISNQLICFIFMWITFLGLTMMLMFFIPDNFAIELEDHLDEMTSIAEWVYALCMFIAIFVIQPFHTMAGFALYLNRRIELEAWDIEISFRNLAKRKQKNNKSLLSMLTAMVLVFTLFVAPPPSHAGELHDKKSARQLIEKVLEGDDFGRQKTIETWRFKFWQEDEEEENGLFPEWLIEFIEWLFSHLDLDIDENDSDTVSAATWLKIILIVSFLILVIFLLRHFRGPLGRLVSRNKKQIAPEVLFGLDVTPESLPQNVPKQVLVLWQKQDYREALGLLYRASLSRLIEKHEIAFRASHTEAECAALVSAEAIEPLSRYFLLLTKLWTSLAYGHQRPELSQLESLCTDWNEVFSDAK